MALINGVIERRTSTGSDAFFPLWICLDANKFSLSSVFTPKETIWPKTWTKSPPNKVKRLLMVDLRFCLLKLPHSCALQDAFRLQYLSRFKWWMTKRFNNLIVETQAMGHNRLHSLPRILADLSRAQRSTMGKKIGNLCIQEILFLRKSSVRTSTPSCKLGWNSAFQAPARFGGKSYSFPTF